jgi:hypothetical protein
VLLLERLDESNVLLLSVGRRDTLVDQLLPCVSLGLALLLKRRVSGVFSTRRTDVSSRVRGCKCYLEIEHAGLVRGLDGRVLGTLLEESVELYPIHSQFPCGFLPRVWCCNSYLEELVIRRLSLELTAVLDGLLEVCGLGDHICGNIWFRKGV